ncbi:T9SS type A sorting domain-containing protein [Arcicella aquatica]|uniref:T9SS type A sorting domain-containing protein n=1 Tax=Arcicella aquatica TaxID=217141 RepID=A0ABU5QKY7_9BACT|nr:T9SS type A sorting domain-containing protein [Arcicella aquatica]MEA5257600.1 T9SS type A sorting domain-containing protein [Arcicella aquatica]
MKKLILTTVILLSFITLVRAQITLMPTFNYVCRGATLELPFTSISSFQADNTFKVQIKEYYSNTWTDLVTTGNSSPLKFTIQSSFPVNEYSNYYIRIISSKPQIISNEYAINRISTTPIVNLAGIIDPVINPNSQADLLINGVGTLPIKVVLDDSSSINISFFESGKGFPIYPTTSKEYKIAYAENVCGRGTASGSTKVTVNEIGLLLLSNVDKKTCTGGILKLPYSTNNSFNQDNKFKVILKQVSSEKKEYEIDATDKGGFLETTIPDYITTGMNYELRISSSSPKATSPSTFSTIFIAPTPSAELTSYYSPVNFDEDTRLSIALKGFGPWNITLSNGTFFQDLNTYAYDYPIYTPDFKLQKTTDIKIVSAVSGCGVATIIPKTFTITVLNSQGLKINNLKESPSLCSGESFEATYSTFGDWGSDQGLSAFLSDGQNQLYAKIAIPATFKDGKMKVTIPNDFFTKTSYSNFYLGIIYKNEKIAYSPFLISISSIPQVTFYNENETITIPSSGEANLPIFIRGVGKTTVILDDSTSQTFYPNSIYGSKFSFPVKVLETTTFKIASYNNLCGKTISTDNKLITIKVIAPPTNAILLKRAPERICVGTSAKVYFNLTGVFNADNDFKVELRSNDGKSIFVGTAKSSPIEIKIPENILIDIFTSYYIRVVATNPSLSSEQSRIYINKMPSATITTSANISNGIISNKEIFFDVNKYEGLSSTNILTFSDGSVYTGTSGFRKSFSESTTFSLVSIKNECGINTDTKNNLTINVFPFITKPTENITIFGCTDKLISYPYYIEGNMKTGTTFTLQIASSKDSIFRDIVVNTSDNPIQFKLPYILEDGSYFLRLVSNTTPKYYSVWQFFNLYPPPVIELSTNDGSNIATSDGESAIDLIYKLKKGIAGSIITTDNYNQTYIDTFYQDFDKNIKNQKVYPTKTTTYTLKSATNFICGYGKVSGSVKITVRPSVKLNSLDAYTICPEKDILLNCSTLGEFADDNIFKFSLVDDKNNKTEIGQVSKLQGTLKIKMPKTLSSSTYKIEVSSTNPIISKELVSYLGVLNLPDVTISGNTIINQGQIAYISLINNVGMASSNSNLKFTLSDNIERTINNGDQKSSIFVNPNQTTTYTLKSASNICGIGKISGSATVIVNPASDKTINTSLQNNTRYLCLGSTQELSFTYQGSFSTNNKFSVQISDKNGDNYKNVVSEGNSSPLKFKVPEDLPIGDNYRVRVIASDVNVSSASNIYPLTVNTLSTAELDSTTYLFREGKPLNMKINLTGTPPWYVKFGSDELLTAYSQAIYSSPYIRTITPTMPTSYKIFAVSDGYCLGKVIGTGIAKIELVTANEDPRDLNITVFPNPTSDFVKIRSDYFKNTKLKIVDAVGKDILEQELVKSETVLDISGFSSGLYFLQFNRDNKRVVYKIQKL